MKKPPVMLSDANIAFLMDYASNPDKYVFPFVIKEETRTRSIITYNQGFSYGLRLRGVHEKLVNEFETEFCERDEHSFAYHKNIRTLDAVEDHLQSRFFIKLDIHHFFESITEEVFFSIYGNRFNSRWKGLLHGCFYKGALSIGYVTSPAISDYFMSTFDQAVGQFIEEHPELHYSRYCDDMLLSSEAENDESLEALFTFVREELSKLHLELNDKKTRKVALSLEQHNAIGFLGLNISRKDKQTNKITISKQYILFLLFLIEKTRRYHDHCRGLVDEINSRVAYLAYNSPVSFERFQKKHTQRFGEPYHFVPRKPVERRVGNSTKAIVNLEDYRDKFVFNIHASVKDPLTNTVIVKNGISIRSCLVDEEEIEIPAFVDIIEANAFSRKLKLKKVTMHYGVKYIAHNAFYYDKGLEEVDLPESLVGIGEYAFFACDKLSKIDLPKKLQFVGKSAFGDTAIKHVVFPEKFVKIGEKAFSGCKCLESVAMNSKLSEIGDGAFELCPALSEIKLPESLLYLPSSAFAFCASLKHIVIPASLLSIGERAFYSCSLLDNIHIPAALVNIEPDSFGGCFALKQIEVDPNNSAFDIIDGAFLVERNTKRLLFAVRKNEVPDGIKIIGRNCFVGSLIEELKLPESVEIIENNAFADCLLLKRVILPKGLKRLGESSFIGCISLEEIEIPAGVKVIENGVFKSCVGLKRVVFHKEGLEKIGRFAFAGCASLEDIEFPSTLKTIQFNAFDHCYGLRHLFIPAATRFIDPYAFLGTAKNLLSIEVEDGNNVYRSMNANILVKANKGEIILGCRNSVIPSGIVCIGSHAFSFVEGLSKMILPETVEAIDDGAFYRSGIESIDTSAVQTIGDKAFFGCLSLKELILRTSLVHIGKSAFQSCEGLEELALPDSLVEIGERAFESCKNLKSLQIPNLFVKFDFWKLFKGCESIEHFHVDPKCKYFADLGGECLLSVSVVEDKCTYALIKGTKNTVIPKEVSVIGRGAFRRVAGLTQITIPEGVQSILSGAFEACSDLARVDILGDPLLGTGCFAYCACLTSMDLSSLSLDALPASTFAGCKALSEICLPENLTEIGMEAFKKCVMLGEVKFGEKVTAIRDHAFDGCAVLQEVEVHGETPSIGAGAFEGCVSLKHVHFDEVAAPVLGARAFAGCVELKTIDHFDQVTAIGARCFEHCFEFKFTKAIARLTDFDLEAWTGYSGEIDVIIPETMKGIFYNDTFRHGPRVGVLQVDEGNEIYRGSPDMNALIENEGDILVLGIHNAKIPEGVKTIASGAFAFNAELEEAIIPSSVAEICEDAFRGCDHLKRVVISEGVEMISDSAFRGCVALQEIVIPDSVAEIKSSAFQGCNSLTRVQFGKGLKAIRRSAFEGCALLENVVLPESLERLELDAFAGCDAITRIELPKGLTVVGDIFRGLANLKEIVIHKDNVNFTDLGTKNVVVSVSDRTLVYAAPSARPSFDFENIASNAWVGYDGEELIIPEGVVSIDASAFSNAKKLKRIVLPASLVELSPSAFIYCDNLEEIIVSPENPEFFGDDVHHSFLAKRSGGELVLSAKNVVLDDRIRSIASGADARRVLSIFVSKSLRRLGGLLNFDNLESIVVDPKNPLFDSREGCNALIETRKNRLIIASAKMTIPGSVEHLAFSWNNKLTSISIPKGVKTISASMFYHADSLKHIEIDPENAVYETRGVQAIITKEKDYCLFVVEGETLPEGIIVRRKPAPSEQPSYPSAARYAANRKTKSKWTIVDGDLPF